MTHNFIPFSNVKTSSYGGKANNLAILYNNNFNVPNGFIITAKSIEDKINTLLSNELINSKEAIIENQSVFSNLILDAFKFTQKTFGDTFNVAIRSSVNLEDGSEFSFAGQFSSSLNISTKTDFTNGFMECLLSKYNNEAVSYCTSNNIDFSKLKINIIVQEMVIADFSGVCFSVNPLTGNEKEMIIDVINGLGEELVQGKITPNTYKINWYENSIKKKEKNKLAILSDEILHKITTISLKIQQHFGLPQDIEWCLKGNELYILQARPLTAIHFNAANDWTNADLKDGGISSEIATPFLYKLYKNAFETTMSPYLKSIKIHPPYKPKKWFREYMLYSYWNLSATKDGLKKIPGFIEREFDEDLGIKPNYKGKGHVTKFGFKSIINGIRILNAINKSINLTLENASTELKKIDKIITDKKNINWHKLSDKEFLYEAKKLVEQDYIKVEGSYFLVIYNNSNLTTLFKDKLAKYTKKNNIEYLKLITGLQNLSHLQPSFELWNLSRDILSDSEAISYYKNNDKSQIIADFLNNKAIPLKKKLDDFIIKYGFHSEKEINLNVAHWHENPEQVFATLLNLLHKKDTQNIVLKNKKQKLVFEKELRLIKSKKLQKEVLKHRHFLWLREEYRDRSTKMYDIIRSVFLIAGKRLTDKNILKKTEDIFFVYPSKVEELFQKNKEELDYLKKNEIIFKSFRNFNPSNEIWKEITTTKNVNTENSLQGIACSYGIIEGIVYVVNTIKDAEKMPEGHIMVTKFTDPSWTVYFTKIIGLITETGGVLSHGAIISREYGIPAILGIENITKTLKTGDKVRLNGSNGYVELI